MDRNKPTYDLAELQALVKAGGLCRRITERARTDAEQLGYDEADIVDVVLSLSCSDFDVSLESIVRPGLWQDVYWPTIGKRRLYVKLQRIARKDGSAAVIISFHKNTAKRRAGHRGGNQ